MKHKMFLLIPLFGSMLIGCIGNTPLPATSTPTTVLTATNTPFPTEKPTVTATETMSPQMRVENTVIIGGSIVCVPELCLNAMVDQKLGKIFWEDWRLALLGMNYRANKEYVMRLLDNENATLQDFIDYAIYNNWELPTKLETGEQLAVLVRDGDGGGGISDDGFEIVKHLGKSIILDGARLIAFSPDDYKEDKGGVVEILRENQSRLNMGVSDLLRIGMYKNSDGRITLFVGSKVEPPTAFSRTYMLMGRTDDWTTAEMNLLTLIHTMNYIKSYDSPWHMNCIVGGFNQPACAGNILRTDTKGLLVEPATQE